MQLLGVIWDFLRLCMDKQTYATKKNNGHISNKLLIKKYVEEEC